MKDLEKVLKATSEKYRKKLLSVYSKENNLESLRDNALKFDPINKEFVSEIIENLNDYQESNPKLEREEIIELGQKYIKDFMTSNFLDPS